jgi:HK97 family phage portal protein
VSLIRRQLESRAVSSFGPIDPNGIPRNSMVAQTWSGTAVSERTALQQIAVWACVSLIADTVSALPIGAFRKVGPTRVEVNPTPSLLLQPYAELDIGEWLSQLLVSLLLRGNAYGWIYGRDGLGFATDVMPLHPDAVRPQRNSAGRIEYYVTSSYDGLLGPGPGPKAGKVIADTDMVHMRGLMLPGTRVGLSPIEYARQGLGLAMAAEEFGARFFGDGASPSSILETPNEIDGKAARRMKADWVRAHGQRHREPAVLSGGVTWKSVSLAPEEAQFLETRKFQTAEIARLFRVPPHLIGDVDKTTSWGTGIEEQALGWITYGLGTWITRFERSLSALTPRGQYARMNVASLLRGRTLERYDTYLKGRNGGWLSVDEIRALEDMAPVPDGKGTDFLQPLNMGLLGNDPAKTPAPADPAPVADGQGARAAAEDLAKQERERALVAELRHAEEISALREETDRLRSVRRMVVRRDDAGLITHVEEEPTDGVAA